jgi:hypothetical protein
VTPDLHLERGSHLEVTLPRTFVSFSKTDIARYQMMCAWKANDHIDFNFADCRLDEANSENENYIKRTCREKFSRPTGASGGQMPAPKAPQWSGIEAEALPDAPTRSMGYPLPLWVIGYQPCDPTRP